MDRWTITLDTTEDASDLTSILQHYNGTVLACQTGDCTVEVVLKGPGPTSDLIKDLKNLNIDHQRTSTGWVASTSFRLDPGVTPPPNVTSTSEGLWVSGTSVDKTADALRAWCKSKEQYDAFKGFS